MKLYQLTFMDTERGKIKRWKRNKREIKRLIMDWEKRFPLRQLVDTEMIEFRDRDKQGLVDWLNANCGGDK